SPGDSIIGLSSSGLHSNGYTLARHALLTKGRLKLQDHLAELQGQSVGETLLTPTVIYVKAVMALLESDIPVHGLAHIIGGGIFNLARLSPKVSFEITDPLPVHPIFSLIKDCGEISDKEMWNVFNMGCGFCVIVPAEFTERALTLLRPFHTES